jgi:hypothetical protein
MQQMFRCPRCGAPVFPNQPFCNNCGLQVPRSCPRCRAFLGPQATFCTNCGLALGPGAPQPGKQPAKPKSAVSIFGDILFGLGIVCAIAVPVWIVLQPETESSMSSMIKAFAVGGVMAIIGLIMMRK